VDYLADTNIVARWALPTDPLHVQARDAVIALESQGDSVYITAQNLIEFWALATRPLEANGLGMTPMQASAIAQKIEAGFALLMETPTVFPIWKRLADLHSIVGRQVYDTRLVAVMQTHGVTHILTFNGKHFRRFPGITVVEPQSLL
jgi:predicted nucleic acid-binding protein